jgi:pimeloyl-ACP methyl ester carboxylesterase
LKIILLPGMDGTGLLFKPFLSLLSTPHEIISFPSSEDQTYESIYTYVKGCMPAEEFFVVAESFSGPLAARLASENLENMKGVVFVATFLSCPSKILVRLAKLLPLKFLLKFPLTPKLVQKFLIGNKFPLELFYDAVAMVSDSELKSRLTTLEQLDTKPNKIFSYMPALYLCANNDLLVSKKYIKEFISGFPNIFVLHVQGTHFLLQSNPQACAELISNFRDTI